MDSLSAAAFCSSRAVTREALYLRPRLALADSSCSSRSSSAFSAETLLLPVSKSSRWRLDCSTFFCRMLRSFPRAFRDFSADAWVKVQSSFKKLLYSIFPP